MKLPPKTYVSLCAGFLILLTLILLITKSTDRPRAAASLAESATLESPASNSNQQLFRLPTLDHEALVAAAQELESVGKHRFATPREVDIRPATHGEWQRLGDDRSRWEMDIHSAGATSLNLAFEQFHLPPGATLRLNGASGGQSDFAFTDRDNDVHGQLWTPLVPGDSLSLQLDIDDALVPQMRLALARINHGFRGLGTEKKGKIGDDSSGSCNIDVNCSTADNAQFGPLIDMYRDQIRSVGAYTLGGIDTCSGALINNVAGGTTPYFLTADHCGITSGNAPSVVVYWNFENTTCRQPGSSASGSNGDGPLTQFNSGAIFRAGFGDSDFTLIELDDPVDPATEPFFAGWDRSGSNPGATIAIHHPGVSEKRISFDLDPSSTSDYYGDTSPGDGTHVRVADWDFGTTEGGSSGSPLFDDSGRIIGQLHGGDAACGNDLPDWYGRLSTSWDGAGFSGSRLSDWLDPQASGVVAIDGVNSDEFISVSSATASEGDSGTTAVTLTVTLSPATDETVSVRLATSDGTATSGEDFVPIDTTLTFTPNLTEQTVTLLINGDATPEEHESINLTLSEATNAIASQTPASVIILNDDYTTPAITSGLAVDASAQTNFRYQITALGTPTSYEIASAPTGMSVDALSGQIDWVAAAPGSYNVSITARNPAGAATEVLQITVQPNTLANALDLAASVALNSAVPAWFLQTIVSNDGTDAAQSASIDDSQNSSFSINVTGPDAMRFFWKVSSEADFDFLSVSLDSVEIESITGEVNWVDVLIPIPEGEHELTWSYSKDGSADDGDDAGWVDQVTLASLTGEPIIVSPTRQIVSLGEPFSYEIESFDAAATFTVGSLPDGLGFDGDHTISGTPTASGTFSVLLIADNGLSSNATLELTVVAPIGPALELTSRQWSPSGDNFWFPQSAFTFDGQDAAQAGPISDSQSSIASINVTGPDHIAFWWKVSSEQGYDFLSFELDGDPVRELSGEVDWQRVLFQIPAGNHLLSWAYRKDDSESEGRDSAWLDSVELASASPTPFITSPLAVSYFASEPFGYRITAINSPQSYGAANLPTGLTIDTITGLISGEPQGAGPFVVSIWARNALGRTTQNLRLRSSSLDPIIPPAIEQPLLPVQNDSPSPWSVSINGRVGGTSAQSGLIDDDEISNLTAHVVGPGRATFQWSVASEEDFDFLVCYLDDVEIDSISGLIDWTTVEIELPPGAHQIRWSYQKDGSDFDGLDVGWVDDVQLEGYAAFALENGLRFTEAEVGADPDADGFANLLEFVFASDPGDASQRPEPIAVTVDGDQAEVVFTGRSELAGVALTLFLNNDLRGEWSEVGVDPVISAMAAGMSEYRYTVPVPAGVDSMFFRLQAIAQ